MEVYDGTSANGTLKASFSGLAIPPIQTATSGSMLIRFTSDSVGEGAGVSMTWLDAMPNTLAPTSAPTLDGYPPTAAAGIGCCCARLSLHGCIQLHVQTRPRAHTSMRADGHVHAFAAHTAGFVCVQPPMHGAATAATSARQAITGSCPRRRARVRPRLRGRAMMELLRMPTTRAAACICNGEACT